jgi:putative hydrolase of the HAD superfamily
MIKNIIFDLGDVFIDLDHSSSKEEFLKLGIKNFSEEMLIMNQKYDKGLVTTVEFIQYYTKLFSNKTREQLIDSWNSMLIDFPKHRLTFLETLSNTYRLFLLSNTNETHVTYFRAQVGYDFYSRFANCFEKIYYSFMINHIKPEPEVFQLILDENCLKPEETLFVDDTLKNIESAQKLRIKTWHLRPKKEEVIELFSVKSILLGKQELESI